MRGEALRRVYACTWLGSASDVLWPRRPKCTQVTTFVILPVPHSSHRLASNGEQVGLGQGASPLCMFRSTGFSPGRLPDLACKSASPYCPFRAGGQRDAQGISVHLSRPKSWSVPSGDDTRATAPSCACSFSCTLPPPLSRGQLTSPCYGGDS